MSKLMTKSLHYQIKHQLDPLNKFERYCDNHIIIDLIAMGNGLVGLLRTHSIIVYDPLKGQECYSLELLDSFDTVQYSKTTNIFYAIRKQKKQLFSISNHPKPVCQCLYDIEGDKWGRHQQQWQPWLLVQGEFVVVVRKFYGESLVVVFKAGQTLVPWWRVSCQEDNIGPMDQHRFAVSFSQLSYRRRIKLTVLDLLNRWHSNYILQEQFPDHTCKAVRLYDSEKGATQKEMDQKWVMVIIAINKYNGTSSYILGKLWSESNRYEIQNVIENQHCVHSVFDVRSDLRELLTLQIEEGQNKKGTNVNINLYRLNSNLTGMTKVHSVSISQYFQKIIYDSESQMLMIGNNNGKLTPNPPRMFINDFQLNCWKIISKSTATLHLLASYNKSLLPLAKMTLQLLQTEP